jgi:hypothetical protein
MSTDDDGLGPLPIGAVYTRALGSVGAAMYTYTADQMRAYRAEGVAAERERIAELLDAEHELRKHMDNYAAYYARLIRESPTAPGPTKNV